MKQSWYVARLRRMSLSEMVWRTYHTTCSLARGTVKKPSHLSQQAGILRKTLPPLVTQQQITFFSESFSWQGEDIPWQGSFQNESLSTRHYSRINYRDTARFGDPKRTWELNRQQFLRHWVTEEKVSLADRVNAVSHLILHWIESNPLELGLNWCSSLEAALRIVSWQSAVEFLGQQSFTPGVLDIIQKSVIEHSHYLRRNPSLFSSANNHRIGELVGLMAAGAMFPACNELATSARRAWITMQKESQKQVSPDGVSREQAFYYHAYVLLYFRRAKAYAETLCLHCPTAFTDLIGKMQFVLNAATGQDGQWFEIGDRDDGDLVSLQAYAQTTPLSRPCQNGTYHLRDGGYAIWKSDSYHVLFRCGNFGYPSIAAHSHCDQLSVLLKINNVDVLTDSGTGDYHENERWRRYFRGTTAHNTLIIDGADQAQYGGPFLWMSAPVGKMTEVSPGRVAGHTDAWDIGTAPVVHRREVAFSPEENSFLSVTDNVTAVNTEQAAHHDCELIWNFGPEVRLKPGNCTSTSFEFILAVDDAPIANLLISSSVNATYSIFHGDESEPAGFFSRKFGERNPIDQLRIRCNTPAWDISTIFSAKGNA